MIDKKFINRYVFFLVYITILMHPTWGWRCCSKWFMVKLSNTYTYSRSFLIETLYTRTLIHSVEGQVNRLSMNVTCFPMVIWMKLTDRHFPLFHSIEAAVLIYIHHSLYRISRR